MKRLLLLTVLLALAAPASAQEPEPVHCASADALIDYVEVADEYGPRVAAFYREHVPCARLTEDDLMDGDDEAERIPAERDFERIHYAGDELVICVVTPVGDGEHVCRYTLHRWANGVQPWR